jgi:hypothetical protein
MWYKFAEELERLRAELKERPRVVGRYAQAYAAVIAALRAYGQHDLANRVIAMLESRERRDEALELFAATISGMWDDVVSGRLPDEIYVRKTSLSDGSSVVFVPLTSVVRYAASRLIAISADMPQVTDRMKVEESANASLRTIEHWIRRTIPQEMRNDKNLLAYLQGHPALRLLLFKARNQYGHSVWSIAVTEEVTKALSLLASIGDIEVAVAVFCTIRRRICEEVDIPQKEQVCRAEDCEELQQAASSGQQQEPAGGQQAQHSWQQDQLATEQQQSQSVAEQRYDHLATQQQDQSAPRRKTKSKDEILKEFDEILREYGES